MTISNSKHTLSGFQPNVLSLLNFCKGIAIAWVFLYHWKPGWFGWQGVHIFIVLSGFGLTYSCLRKPGDISWKQWYLRRAERILPAYWLVCLLGFLIMLCFDLLKKQASLVHLLKSTINLILHLLCLQGLSFKIMFTPPPNNPLWYISLIVSCYLVFPWLYQLYLKNWSIKSHLLILLGGVAFEFLYRAFSLYWLDGFPVGFEDPDVLTRALPILRLIDPVNRYPDNSILFFQNQAPFGLFPSRIAEFMLGMSGAIFFTQNPQKFNKIFISFRVGIAGLLIWLTGYALVFLGVWSWIFADFFISLGLALWVVNLAWIFQEKVPFWFRKLSQLGTYSYQVFLTHSISLFLFLAVISPAIELDLYEFPSTARTIFLLVFSIGFMVVVTLAATCLLVKFEQSKFPSLLFQKILAKFYRGDELA